jgi:hypothetical protein
MLVLYCDGHHALGLQADSYFGTPPAKSQKVNSVGAATEMRFEDKADVCAGRAMPAWRRVKNGHTVISITAFPQLRAQADTSSRAS